MYKLQIQTKTNVKVVENPVEARINKTSRFSSLEIKNDSGIWISIVRFLDLSHLDEEKEAENNVINEINEAIRKRKNYVFFDM